MSPTPGTVVLKLERKELVLQSSPRVSSSDIGVLGLAPWRNRVCFGFLLQQPLVLTSDAPWGGFSLKKSKKEPLGDQQCSE